MHTILMPKTLINTHAEKLYTRIISRLRLEGQRQLFQQLRPSLYAFVRFTASLR